MLTTSISIHKGYTSIVVLNRGREIHKKVVKVGSHDNRPYTERYLELLIDALKVTKTVTEQQHLIDLDDIVIELKCKQLIKWFETLSAPKNLSVQFVEAYKVLETLPYRYLFMYSDAPTAKFYAKDSHIKKERYTTIFDMV